MAKHGNDIFVYEGYDFARLRQDHLDYGVMAGDYGLVWGFYGTPPMTFEACFCPQDGEDIDMMFEADEVEWVPILILSPCP